MSAITASFLHLASLEPRDAAIWAVKHVTQKQKLGRKEWNLVTLLQQISYRESKHQRVGLHSIDAWAGPLMYRRAVRARRLSPETCPHHRATTKAQMRRFSVRGSWGLSAAYNSFYVGACIAPEWLDVPAISALAAARKAIHHRGDVRAAWSGYAKCNERRAAHGDCSKRRAT